MSGCTCGKAKIPSTATRNATRHIPVYHKAITKDSFTTGTARNDGPTCSTASGEIDTTRTSLRSPCANKQHHDIAADEAAEFDAIRRERVEKLAQNAQDVQ